MKPHNEPKKSQIFSKQMVKSGQKMNTMYGCHGNLNAKL